jgi:hypothetical protein
MQILWSVHESLSSIQSVTLKPKIAYLDETGTSKYNEPKPAMMTVREIGIKGWLKGER